MKDRKDLFLSKERCSDCGRRKISYRGNLICEHCSWRGKLELLKKIKKLEKDNKILKKIIDDDFSGYLTKSEKVSSMLWEHSKGLENENDRLAEEVAHLQKGLDDYYEQIKQLKKQLKESDKQVKHNAKELLRVISDNKKLERGMKLRPSYCPLS